MYLDELSTFEFRDKIKNNPKTVIILPLGAVEEHGDHLPLSTDSLQPEYVASIVAKESELDILIAPAIRYGICDTARNFSGTITLSFNTFKSLIQEILEQLCRHGVKNIVVLSGHAGRVQMAALKVAGIEVVDKFDVNLMVLSDYDIIYKLAGKEFPEWDGHAGSVETSRIMAISPELVKGKGKLSKVEFPQYRILRNPEEYFPSGILGNPEAANKETGEKMNRLVIDELKRLIAEMV